jgi:hypothetical protein
MGISLAACDLDMKDLGDETETAGDDGGGTGTVIPGGTCEPGTRMPADDGCNTCDCTEEGQWACTEIGCDQTQGTGGADGDDDGADGGPPPGMCQPGDTWEDDCNTCSCENDGQTWSCTALDCGSTGGGACVPGEEMPAEDGCNTCTCTDDGGWACTDMACPAQVNICEAADPDYATIVAASISGDDLLVSLSYSGGCEEQSFHPCWDGSFAESNPVQTWLALSHSGAFDPCDSIVNEDLSFSLLPMRQAYEDGYQTTSGTIIVHLDGWGGSLTYSW